MKRFFDFVMGVVVFGLVAFPMLVIAIMISLTSTGPVFYWADRVGVNNVIFRMPKFRSMRTEAPSVATHLMTDAEKFLTPVGKFLRSYSLDELPQIFSIIKGDMSFVGPRPSLFNQKDLITLRKEKGIDKIQPGVTGWAQVNGRDNLSIAEKVRFDEEYLNYQSFWFDMKILWLTLVKVLKRDDITH